MRPHEGGLSGYLLARAAMGRKIDDATESRKLPDGRILKSENVLRDLRAANDSLEETRRLLPNGRGNVKGDILATGGEASRRYAAGALLRDGYLEKKGPAGKKPRFAMQAEAAVSLFTGQASCGGSALIAAHVHAPRLGMGQQAVTVANVGVDHMWTESRRQGSDPDNHPIIDRWTSGPAVLKEDSSFGLATNVQDGYSLNASDRGKAIRNVNGILREIKADPGLNAEFQANMRALDMMDYRFQGKIWDEENVMAAGFRRDAGIALHPDASRVAPPEPDSPPGKRAPALPFSQEILAAGVARSLGEGVRTAAEMAPGILGAAKRMFPKPPKQESA